MKLINSKSIIKNSSYKLLTPTKPSITLMINSNSEKSHSAPPKSPQSVTGETKKKLTLSWTAVPQSSERGLIPRDNPGLRENKNN